MDIYRGRGEHNIVTLEKMVVERDRYINETDEKLAKLKSLMLLTDPVVGHIEMNELTKTQWMEFIKAFPDENPEKLTGEGE
jgi:hypothetical protein